MENEKERKKRTAYSVDTSKIMENVKDSKYNEEDKSTLWFLAKRLNELLEEQKIDQEVFAVDIGIAEGSLSNYRTGKRFPDGNVLAKMSKKLKVSTDYLLGLSNLKSPEKDIKISSTTTGLLDDQTKYLEYMKNNTPELTYILNLLLNPKKNPYFIKLLKALKDYLLKLNEIETTVKEKYNYIPIEEQNIRQEYEESDILDDPKEAEYVCLFKITEIAKQMAKKLKELNKEV